MVSQVGWVQNEDRRPKTQKRRPPQNLLEITWKRFTHDSRNKEHRDLRLSMNLTGVFVLYITLPKVQNEDPFKIVLKSLPKRSYMILDRSRNKEHRDLRLSMNLTGVFVLYITLPNVQNEDPFKIVLKSLPKGLHMILDRSRNKEH